MNNIYKILVGKKKLYEVQRLGSKKTNLINIDCNFKAAGKQVKDNQRVYMYSSG